VSDSPEDQKDADKDKQSLSDIDPELLQEALRQAAAKQKYQDTEKPFWDHFDELRVRLVRCVYVFLGTTCVAWLAHKQIMNFLMAPLIEVLPDNSKNLVFTGVFEGFLTSLRVAAIAGFFLAIPFVLFQVWQFIAPGLKEKERKLAIPFTAAGTIFFLAGSAFAFYFVFPHGFRFMIEHGESLGMPMISIKEYFGLIFRLFLLFGLSFQFPVVLVFFGMIGVVNAKMLREQRRMAVIAIAVVCAVTAPPDVLSMIFMMVPMYLFYEGAIMVIQKVGKK